MTEAKEKSTVQTHPEFYERFYNRSETTYDYVEINKNHVFVYKVSRLVRLGQKIRVATGKEFGLPVKTTLSKNTEEIIFPLVQVNVKKIHKRRNMQKPTLVVKRGKNFFAAKIPKEVKLVSSQNSEQDVFKEIHLCRSCSNFVNCPKIRIGGSCIENYNFLDGYETFGTKVSSFVVTACSYHKECCEHEKKSAQEILKAHSGLNLFTCTTNKVGLEFFEIPDLFNY